MLVALAAVLACDGLGPAPTGDGAPIRTNSTVYHLSHQYALFTVRMRTYYTNDHDTPVYLHRACGYGDQPYKVLVRADGSERPIDLGRGVCITQPLRLPIEVAPGATFIDEFELSSTESPNAVPPITMDMRTGVFRLEYFIQRTNRVDGWWPVDLIPLDQRISNVFRVDPP
jgi:hypothetical protein